MQLLMNRFLHVLITFSLFSLMLGCSQKAFQGGYVITSMQDTLRGTVADRNFDSNPRMLDKVELKPEQGRKRKYTADQLQGYQRGGSDFHSVNLTLTPTKLSKFIPPTSKQEFLRVIEPGFVTLYAQDFVDFDGPHYDVGYYFKRQDLNTFQRVNMIMYRKQARTTFYDNPQIVEEIRDGKWRYRAMVELVVEYNRRR